ncbi:MAG: HD domain-containing protein [Gammaproteobacteria bacterium]
MINNRLTNKSTVALLRKRFLELWRRCSSPCSTDNANVVYQDILTRYGTPDRYYHDLNHLSHCLDQLDLVACLIPQADKMEMALWFHDAVYKPGDPNNEKKSAALFLAQAEGCFSEDFKHAVEQLILITEHRSSPKNEDERYVVDIDLSSFGSDWNHFLEDSGNLRKERIDVSDQAYFQTHTRFLKYLLARDRIFYTDFFYIRYERIARENIYRLLDKRKSLGYT